eukprot:6175385-Pleurochrysis_carterae.AAC.8
MLRIRQQLAVIAESAGTHWHADVDFDKSGQALAPFSMTQKILLLPSAAVDDLKGQRLPGLRSDVDAKASTFVCHTKASRKVDRMQRCNFDYACLKEMTGAFEFSDFKEHKSQLDDPNALHDLCQSRARQVSFEFSSQHALMTDYYTSSTRHSAEDAFCDKDGTSCVPIPWPPSPILIAYAEMCCEVALELFWPLPLSFDFFTKEWPALKVN